ncbi:MAG: hypothetical protein WCO54_08845 [Bacteroidota bacterium]
MENNIEKAFNWAIIKAEKTKNKFFIEDAILNKRLYYLSRDLSIDDWRAIRSGNYYEIRDKLEYAEQKRFIIDCILTKRFK